MLFEAHPEIDIHEMSPLALAFAGDAVLELLVRQRLVETSRLQPGRLHSVATVSYTHLTLPTTPYV